MKTSVTTRKGKSSPAVPAAAQGGRQRTPRAKTDSAGAKFDTDKYVRIVPLYAAKPTMTLRELLPGEVHDPFHGTPLVAVQAPRLTYRGGALLQNVEVFAIFWGKQWATSPSAKALIAEMNQFFADILGSALIDQRAEYNVAGKKIGHGKFIGSKVIGANAPATSVSDSQ